LSFAASTVMSLQNSYALYLYATQQENDISLTDV
jgi:hypothetical protein